MKKVNLVVMAVLLAAILPPPALQAGQIGVVEAVDRTMVYRIMIPARYAISLKYAGDAYNLQGSFEDYLRLKAKKAGLKVVVWGQAWQGIADAQDQIHLSGRYSPETRRQVPQSKMEAPTQSFVVTVDTVTTPLAGGVNLFSSSAFGVNVSDLVMVKTRLFVQSWNISTGLLSEGEECVGKATGPSGGSVYFYGTRGINLNAFVGNFEQTLQGQSARQAVERFFDRFVPELIELMKLQITSGKIVKKGDSIYFYHNSSSKPFAHYEVLAVEGQDITVKTIKEEARPTNEPFKIVSD